MTAALLNSLANFKSDVARNSLFLSTESKITNPASCRSRPRSETLLSAYVSLTCGRFEFYLQEAFLLAADDLRNRIVKSNDPRIPKGDKFHKTNIKSFISWSVGQGRRLDWSDLEAKILAYAQAISAGDIFPESFQYTNANPNAETLKEMFQRFGIEDCFRKLSAKYVDSLGVTLNDNLIKNKLNTFVLRRHEAAHHGRIPNMTRADAAGDDIFILALASAVNAVLVEHISAIT